MAEDLKKIYDKLFKAFGPQHWWPGDTPFEIAVGAILTQNTNWGNVEKAIGNLKRENALSAKAIYKMPLKKLAKTIRPAGYFNIKAGRLRSFIEFIVDGYGGSIERMKVEDTDRLRRKLLSVKGIGPETADSILLYALGKEVFVIDAYTKRVLSRHGIMEHDRPYEEFQGLFHKSFKKGAVPLSGGAVPLFNEYHALFVMVGKTFCKKLKPLCGQCPLSGYN